MTHPVAGFDIDGASEAEVAGLLHRMALVAKVIDELPISVGVQSLPDRRFTLVNKAFEKITSAPRTKILCGTLQDLMPGRDLGETYALEAAALDSGAVKVRHVPIVDPQTGEPGMVELRKVALTVEDAHYMLTTSEDISALMRSQAAQQAAVVEAQEANAAKSLFLATMSHEIRTPLNGVLGMAQAMEQGTLDEVQRERLSIIRQSGEALLAILNDILDLSKIEAGKMTIEEMEFDLGELLNGAHATFTALANKKALSFVLEVKDAGGVYRGDPGRIRQILYNLCSNALKFTEKGHIGVEATYAHGRLRLSVFDTGIGIEAEVLKTLFSDFVQADASTTRKFGGTGLGLAICRKLAMLMGGDIQVTSEPGRGSTFLLDIPLARFSDAAATPHARAPAADTEEPAQLDLRILAAEDNRINQLVLKTLLHQAGIDPHVVENGRQALTAWEAQEWDVILMDVQMPTMDGPTATRLIRAREAETGRRRTPIIALTANAMAQQVAGYLAEGMDGCVTKPMEVGALFQTIAAVLDREDAEDEAGARDAG